MAGAPSVEHTLALSHERYFFFAFALPLVVAAVLEGSVVAISDRLDRRRLLATSQTALAISLFAVALVHEPWTMGLALAAAGTTSGIACSAAQATLVTKDPRGADRALLTWSLYSSIGDVLTPIVTCAALACGYTYRFAMALVAIVVTAQALVHGFSRADPSRDDSPETEETSTSLSQAFSRAIRAPKMWIWLAASASCTLLDELVIAVVALRLVRDGRASESAAALAAVFFAAGAALGAAVADRIVERMSAARVLSVSAIASLPPLFALALMHGFAATAISLFALGALVATHHPLSLARAYACLPENPGVVQACVQLFVIVDVGAPIAIGFVADRLGLSAAIACLALQPLAILASAAIDFF